ncbi:hypothetical protein Dimus_015582 [Dionaea muscipula]
MEACDKVSRCGGAVEPIVQAVNHYGGVVSEEVLSLIREAVRPQLADGLGQPPRSTVEPVVERAVGIDQAPGHRSFAVVVNPDRRVAAQSQMPPTVPPTQRGVTWSATARSSVVVDDQGWQQSQRQQGRTSLGSSRGLQEEGMGRGGTETSAGVHMSRARQAAQTVGGSSRFTPLSELDEFDLVRRVDSGTSAGAHLSRVGPEQRSDRPEVWLHRPGSSDDPPSLTSAGARDLSPSSEGSSPAMADGADPLKRSEDLWLQVGSSPDDSDDSARTVKGTHPAAVGGEFGEGMDSLMANSGDLLASPVPARGAAWSPIFGSVMNRFPLPSPSDLVGLQSSSSPDLVEKDSPRIFSPSSSPLAALIPASVNVADPLAAADADKQAQGDDVGAEEGVLLSIVLVSSNSVAMIGDVKIGSFDDNYGCDAGGVVREEGQAPPVAKEAVRPQPADGLRQPLRLSEEPLPVSLGHIASTVTGGLSSRFGWLCVAEMQLSASDFDDAGCEILDLMGWGADGLWLLESGLA